MSTADEKKRQAADEKPQNVHAGHRGRMKKRYMENGLEGFAEHEILELLLMYAIPQKNVNPLAHDLLDIFGSLSKVLRADRKLLAQVKGMGETSATMLGLVEDIMQYVEKQRIEEEPAAQSTISNAARYCLKRLNGLTNETLLVLSLNDTGTMLRCDEVGSERGSEVSFSVQSICRSAILNGAANVILAHNHPSGIVTPSTEDISATKDIENALSVLGINFIDHLIVANGNVYSMRRTGKVIEREHAKENEISQDQNVPIRIIK